MSIATGTPCVPGSLCVRGLGPGSAPAEPGATPAAGPRGSPQVCAESASILRRACAGLPGAAVVGGVLPDTIVQGSRCGEPQSSLRVPERCGLLNCHPLAVLLGCALGLCSCFVNAPCLHS